MPSLVQYLSEIKAMLGTSSCPRAKHLVVGNEACDLDSAVCAIVYGYLLHSVQKERKSFIVPVLNIPREDYSMKTEVTYWLSKHHISEEHLVFRDDLDLSFKATSNLSLTLVDHNMLSVRDKHLEPKVISILDHHKLERAHPEKVKGGIVTEMVGSCTTIVTEEVLKDLPQLLDATTASLLYGTIILDTVNLSEAAKRVTEKDIEICKRLETLLNPLPDRTEIFEELTCAKADISHLTCDQLLRKDVKVAEDNGFRIAVTSVPMLVKDYLGLPDLATTLNRHNEKHKYCLMIIMGIAIIGDSIKRDIAIFSPNADLREKVAGYLCTVGNGVLQLVPFDIKVSDGFLAYDQVNHAASRKVVLPFIREFLSMSANW